jgi:bacillithiol biosynthesis cysteine-adding enzyme BshC
MTKQTEQTRAAGASAEGDCYSLSIVPGLSRLFLDYASAAEPLSPFYSVSPCGERWGAATVAPVRSAAHCEALASLLADQNRASLSGPLAMANIEKLRAGARVVVTGQQVGLFGGPLYTLHKAATAVRLAAQASESTGVPHVPVFWLATEDHDLAEADHVSLSGRHSIERVRLALDPGQAGAPVGSLLLGQGIEQALEQASRLLGGTAEFALLERCYRPDTTFADAFAQWLSATFWEHGLIVLDASSRALHALGREVLRAAILRADELEEALLARDRQLVDRGYHAQVLVSPGSSLLFLLDEADTHPGSSRRVPLKRPSRGVWTGGRARYSTDELLAILDQQPERLSPNALLRPVFQDVLLPTAAYIGGPAEVAYFAQTAVLYERLLGRVTPVLPRLSATLIDAPTAQLLRHFELGIDDVFNTQADALAQRLGARSMPVEGKRSLAAAGRSLQEELDAVTGWMRGLDENLGRSADVAASKMRYQMNRLRRLAANYQLQRDASIRRRVDSLVHAIYPERHLQERIVGAASGLAVYGERLPALLVGAAAQPCPGHKVLYL